jgi:hypothetical protein
MTRLEFLPLFPDCLMSRLLCCLLLIGTLCACSPTFDWREAHGSELPFTVLLPGKYVSASREVELAGQSYKMLMTGAEAGDASFAVGAVRVADAAQAEKVQQAMQAGLLRNIQASASQITADGIVHAQGSTPQGRHIELVARFVVVDTVVYQLLIMGSAQAMQAEVVETFMGSFQAH